MKKTFAALITSALISTTVLAHGDNKHFPQTQDVVVTAKQVVGNIHMLQGRGGNIAAITGADGILIVDDDYKAVSKPLSDALNKLGSATPRFILNTHWHGDHTEGNLHFGNRETVIIAHENVRKRLIDPPMIFGSRPTPYPTTALPIVTYSESMALHVNGEEITLRHYPNGHTDGDTIVFFKHSKVVHLGDDFFVGRFPFVDLESGGSVQGLLNNIDSLIKTLPADAKLIPGHGPLASVDDLKTFHRLVSDSAKVITEAMKAGKSVVEIKKTGLPDKFKEAGSGFIKTDMWIDIVHQSYSKK